MNVFMTGANGFVGLNTVAALMEAGHQVTAYVRPGSNTAYLDTFDVNVVRGTLDDKHKLRSAMQGAQAVIHTAGNTSCNVRDLPALTEANVEGTQHIVDAAIATGVSRIVYTSTTSTIGAAEGRDRAWDEGTPLRGFRSRSPYALTKQRAEAIIQSARQHGLSCVILNPAEVIGPFDHNLQWGRMVLAVHHDQVPFVPPGGGTFCSAIEVGRAHVSALTRGRSGERYILGGEHASYAHFIDMISEVLGKPCSLPSDNYTWLYIKALLQEKLPDLVPGTSIVEPYRMRVFGGHYRFDSGKARKELGYACPPLRQMLAECADWYRRHGHFGQPSRPQLSSPSEERASWIPER